MGGNRTLETPSSREVAAGPTVCYRPERGSLSSIDGRDGARCSDFDGSREVAAAAEIAALAQMSAPADDTLTDGAGVDVSACGRRSRRLPG